MLPVKMVEIDHQFTIDDVSAYYEVSRETTKSIIKRNRKEFDTYDELMVLKGRELKTLRDGLNVKNTSPSVSLFSLSGFLRAGLLLQDSEISEKIKKEMVVTGIPDKYHSVFYKNHRVLQKQHIVYQSLVETFGGVYVIDKQVACGSYKIDIVIDQDIALECDENGHSNYKKEKEEQRERYIESKGYKLIRYNPDGLESIYHLINRIMKLKCCVN